MKEAPSKEELTACLKELEAEKAEQMQDIAMCYCPAPSRSIFPQCEQCGKELYMWFGEKIFIDRIRKIVSEISSLGYDAKVQLCCRECAEKLGNEKNAPAGLIFSWRDIFRRDRSKELANEQNSAASAKSGIDETNFLFSFRANGGSDYYRRIVNDRKMYEKLHALLAKKDFHIEDYRSYGYTPSEKIVFKYMTGLNPDE